MVSCRFVHQIERIRQLNVDLHRANAQLKIAAETDPLTGVLNRRAFFDQVTTLRRQGGTGWLLLLDIDHFKSINDRFGHDVGDKALCLVTRSVTQNLRNDDVIGRLGGEEFAIYLPGAGASDALGVAERIRACVAGTPSILIDQQALCVTVSLGIACDDHESLRYSLKRADAAMYRAKDGGRNQVAMAA